MGEIKGDKNHAEKICRVKCKKDDYYNEVVESLEKEGFTVILETETTIERFYIIAKEEKPYT